MTMTPHACTSPPLAGVADTANAPIAGVDADDKREEENQTETVEPTVEPTAQPNKLADTM